MTIILDKICRHPVKGLTPESLDHVDLVRGEGLPWDRRYALALASTRFDADQPAWLPKTSFLMLMRHERLAALETRFDERSEALSIRRDGREVLSARLSTPSGRSMLEEFFAAYMDRDIGGKPRLVTAGPGHQFSDHRNRVISIINLASLRDLERVVGATVDPLRFRANFYVDAEPPWIEFTWIGKTLLAGAAQLVVTERIDRCAATNVNPASGKRDLNIPKALRQGYGHVDCGVYARVEVGGRIAAGTTVRVGEPAAF